MLFLATRLAHYGQRIYRVYFLDRVFRSSSRTTQDSIASWRWAMALELLTVLTFIAQLAVMAGFFIVLAPVFGAVNVVLMAVLAEILGRLFVRQRVQQRTYVEQKRAGEAVTPFMKLRSRVVSTEIGGFVSSAAVIVLLFALIAMNVAGSISAANTIVLFLGLRLQNSTFVNLSGGVMRMARAHAHTY